jgi:hypothetical protein
VGGNPVSYIDPEGLAGMPKKLPGGNPTTVRIDPPHVPGQQTHAHICEKGCKEIVVNKDGTQSHGSKGSIEDIKNKVKDYLKDKGFTVLSWCSATYSAAFDAAAAMCAKGDDNYCKVFMMMGGKVTREYD